MRIANDATQLIGNTPLVRLRNVTQGAVADVAAKLEFYNPAHSVKDRIGVAMIDAAEKAGLINKDTVIVEPTSGNTGIALAFVCAARGYKCTLIMPETMSKERRMLLRAYGAELILTPALQGGMEHARDVAAAMVARGEGIMLDQFANPDNPRAHYETTGPEIWRDTNGGITHFVSAMGTTGTIMGAGRYLKEQRATIQVVGAQPSEGSQIPGIRKWGAGYEPRIYDKSGVDRLEYVTQDEAEAMARRLAAEEGILCGPSAAGACVIALRLAREVEDATIVFIICDRGDRYLSSGIFSR